MKTNKKIHAKIPTKSNAAAADVIEGLLDLCDHDADLARTILDDEDCKEARKLRRKLPADERDFLSWIVGYVRGLADGVGVEAPALVK